MAHATFHAEARSNPQLYLHRDPLLIPYLERLANAGKQLFVITNSPFETVDKAQCLIFSVMRPEMGKFMVEMEPSLYLKIRNTVGLQK